MTPSPSWTLVLAAGAGTRFGVAKQFTSTAGERLVDLAVQTALEACDHVVLVLPEGARWTGKPVDRIVPGGPTRASSVRAGLAGIPAASGAVVVHQAANPLASPETFRALLAAISAGADAVFPGLPPADVVRATNGEHAGEVVGRDELVLVQAPAAFRLEVLRDAHASGADAMEDTALVSAAGYDIRVVPGDPTNVHVATRADLELVEALLRLRRGDGR